MVSNFFQKWTGSKNMLVIDTGPIDNNYRRWSRLQLQKKRNSILRTLYRKYLENDNFSPANLRCNHQELLSWIIILILNDQWWKIHLYWNFRLHGWKSVNEILLKMSLLNKHIKYLKNKTKEINTGKQFYSYTRF